MRFKWIFVVVIAALRVPPAAAQAPDRLAIQDTLFIPEGIAYDPVAKSFYVGSTYRRKIVRIDARGSVQDFSVAPDLLGVLGMRVDTSRRRLWVASSNWNTEMPMLRSDDTAEGTSALHVFDLETGAIVKKWVLADSAGHFLNDVDILPDGSALVTDTRAQRIYHAKLDDDSLHMFVQLNRYPNGIAVSSDGAEAYVAVWGETNGIVAVDMRTKTVRDVADRTTSRPDGIDGLYWYDDRLIGVQPFRADGKIALFTLNADRTAIIENVVLGGMSEAFEQPTTGAVAGNDFWVIANSHLQTFLRAIRTGSEAKLQRVLLLRISIPE